MAAVQAEAVRASFLFLGDLNGHQQKRLGSKTTNRHGDAATSQLLEVGPTHARGETLEPLMTDVPGLERVAVVARIGNSDHSSMSAVISMVQAVPNSCVSRKILLKHEVNWNTALA